MTLTVIEHAGCPLSSPSISYHPAAKIYLAHARDSTGLLSEESSSASLCREFDTVRHQTLANFIIPRRQGVGRMEGRNETRRNRAWLAGGFHINRLIKSIRTGIMEESGMEEGGRKEWWCGMVKKLLNEGAIEKKLAG